MSITALRRQRASTSVPFIDIGAMTDEVRGELDVVWSDVTQTSGFIGGESVERFERRWAEYCGTKHAVGVANGTDALELALRALGIGPGDEVIVPTNTFVATVEAIVLCGATPRLVDVDEETLLITPEIVRAALSPRTAAVVAVELYGAMPRMDEMVHLAAAAGIALIEDAAQAHGSTWGGRRAGSFGVAASFSFYPGKNLGAFGDAGCIVTDDESLARAMRALGNHGRVEGKPHLHSMVARNSRLDALQAAVLTAKIGHLERWNASRRRAMDSYAKHLRTDLVRVLSVDRLAQSSHHLNVVRVKERDVIRAWLLERGVQTGVHYPVPCHLQEPYGRFASERLPVAEAAALEILSLPIFPHITEQQITWVAECLNEAVEVVHG